jgi:hypothetical protein
MTASPEHVDWRAKDSDRKELVKSKLPEKRQEAFVFPWERGRLARHSSMMLWRRSWELRSCFCCVQLHPLPDSRGSPTLKANPDRQGGGATTNRVTPKSIKLQNRASCGRDGRAPRGRARNENPPHPRTLPQVRGLSLLPTQRNFKDTCRHHLTSSGRAPDR